jgi:hypothetical protein
MLAYFIVVDSFYLILQIYIIIDVERLVVSLDEVNDGLHTIPNTDPFSARQNISYVSRASTSARRPSNVAVRHEGMVSMSKV